MFVSHVLPEKPGLQLQLKLLTLSVQVPSFLHGLGLHSFTFVAHVLPEKPGLQLHLACPLLLEHCPLPEHVLPAHGFFSLHSQMVSLDPLVRSHVLGLDEPRP